MHVKQYVSALVFVVIAARWRLPVSVSLGCFASVHVLGLFAALTNAIAILFIILVASQLAMSVMLADFCMAPANNTLKLADRYLPEGNGPYARDVASFYIICTAQTNATVENPVDRSLASASAHSRRTTEHKCGLA